MRSTNTKADKKPARLVTKKCCSIKKKKIQEQKQPNRDTISETISFVIKGKLTPIKPVIIENKINIIAESTQKKIAFDKTPKNFKNDFKSKKLLKKSNKPPARAKTKVQIETAKKINVLNSTKKTLEKKATDVTSETSKATLKKNSKPVSPLKKEKKKITLKTDRNKKQGNVPKMDKQITKTSVNKPKKLKTPGKKEKTLTINEKKSCKEAGNCDDFKKQQTIDELMKQVNEEILENKKSVKTKKEKLKSKIKIEDGFDGGQKRKSQLIDCHNDIVKIKSEISSGKNSPTHVTPYQALDTLPKVLNFDLPTSIKAEPSSDKEEVESKPEIKQNIEKAQIENHPFGQETKKNKVKLKSGIDKKVSKKKTTHKKLKTKPKMTIMKKRVMSKNKDDEDSKCKTKLFGFWNGPKPHRVASLNALAKVHCLYENESRGNMLDIIDEACKLPYVPKHDSAKNKAMKVKTEDEDEENSDSGTSSPLPTRTLRSVPGLRGAGKHWDMHDTSSSSDDHSDDENIKFSTKSVQSLQHEKTEPIEDKPKKPKKRCRKQNEIMMDLKDMVVRKRMASLNASAILAASYSMEKRQSKTMKNDDTDFYDSSSEEYFAASDNEINLEDEVKKEDDGKLIEVHTTPNKKVAVILNQDTDVTITGVYVNSTTRSTHHEGYCRIAGMQYRISATSHTQTAATAVATETLLQSSSSSSQDNSNSDSIPSSSKSYTPLDALSNMQPPPGSSIQHNHPVAHGQKSMGPPQHVLPMPPHQLSPGLRHSCTSAFSSPHSTPGYPPVHPPPGPVDSGYVHAGYYQPAGPLITVSHGGNTSSASHGQPPPPAPLSKAASLSEASPTSTTPSVASTHDVPPPPPPSSTGGDSSDSEVVITSVTTAKDALPPPPPAHHSVSYRYGHNRYPTPPPTYPYPYHSSYTYHSAPSPHNASYPHPSPHDLCYSPYAPHKYNPSYRRYPTNTQYYPPPGLQDMYSNVAPTNQNQPSQQVVTASPTASGVGAPGSYSSTPAAPAVHPPPTILETFSTPQALVETYQPPPHYYPPPTAYGPAPTCYTHSPARAITYINPTYQSCPCPMQSCPKNGLTGPLTGDSKRSNLNSISKDSMPLPPVALALPLEPNSVTGPPSPARGSAGMPPPPSPAGATYQQLPAPMKQESQSPVTSDNCNLEKKRKARVGKAMVRNNIAAGMQQNTMLLMCNPQTQNYVSTVKREIESPKEKDILEEKRLCPEEETKPPKDNLPIAVPVTEQIIEIVPSTDLSQESVILKQDAQLEEIIIIEETSPLLEPLPPVVNTVAENVKVKNMKRKMSLSKESNELSTESSSAKKQKVGSYKCLIKKETSCVKINNGKRKLIEESPVSDELDPLQPNVKLNKSTTKRKVSNNCEEPKKRLKVTKLHKENTHNFKQRSKSKESTVESLLNKDEKKIKKQPVNSETVVKSSAAALDNLFTKNSIDRTIESVVSKTCFRTFSSRDAVSTKTVNKCIKVSKETVLNKKSTNNVKNVQNNVKTECKKVEKNRKSKCKEDVVQQTITKIPRRSLSAPRWSNGWAWEGEPYQSKVFINSDEMTAVRKCYPAMMHETGDKIVIRDCVLLKAGPRKNDLPFVAKIASLWENPEDGEMMMSLLWYYRPEHTEQGRTPTDQSDEVFASRHKDSNSVACIDDKCYVLTFNEYCRYKKENKRIDEGIEEKTLPCIPNPEPYPRSQRQPPTSRLSPEMVFFCRRVYDFRQKRIMKNPT